MRRALPTWCEVAMIDAAAFARRTAGKSSSKAAFEEPRDGGQNEALLKTDFKAPDTLCAYSPLYLSESVACTTHAIVDRSAGACGRSRGSGASIVPSCRRSEVHNY